jgi:hypothetical protein
MEGLTEFGDRYESHQRRDQQPRTTLPKSGDDGSGGDEEGGARYMPRERVLGIRFDAHTWNFPPATLSGRHFPEQRLRKTLPAGECSPVGPPG